jgi:uncharacterized protein with PIN domain
MQQKAGKAHEDKWFLERDKHLIERLRIERETRIRDEQARELAKERERLRTAHWMRCPKCGHELNEKSFQGITIDICTLCEGIFFDRGELEELLLSKQSAERRGFFRRLIGLGAD